jgi:hypothetical protein
MSDTLDESIKMVVSAKDENEAVRTLIRYEDEIKSHYINVFHYRINDELEFEAKILRFKAAKGKYRNPFVLFGTHGMTTSRVRTHQDLSMMLTAYWQT